ncbi:MAG TPA: hypothetical protein VFG95_07150 [Nitrospiria bacterium]|nr:hypothetical protein [Nitrospiria bacterium]
MSKRTCTRPLLTSLSLLLLFCALTFLNGCGGGTETTQTSNWSETWRKTTSLPQGIYSHAAATDGKFIYVVGGIAGGTVQIINDSNSGNTGQNIDTVGNAGPLNTVYQAEIGKNNDLGAWSRSTIEIDTNSGPVTKQVMGHGALLYEGFLYAIGGILNPIPTDNSPPPTGTIFSTESFYAPIQTNGVPPGPWTKSPFDLPNPNGVAFYGYAVAADSVFVIGGYNDVDKTLPTVFRAPIQPDGTLGNWDESAPHLPIGLNKHEVVATSKALYVIGGMTADPGFSDFARKEVYFSTFDPNGILSSWTPTSPLPHPLFFHAAANIEDKAIVVIGGGDEADDNADTTHVTNEVWVAEINFDGSLGPWLSAAPLPGPRFREAAVVTHSTLYVIGGEKAPDAGTNQTNRQPTVYVGELNYTP